jgi:hypothetical protein
METLARVRESYTGLFLAELLKRPSQVLLQVATMTQ